MLDSIYRTLGGLMERYCNSDLVLILSQNHFMLSTVNSFKLRTYLFKTSKDLYTAVLYLKSKQVVLYSYAVSKYSSSNYNEVIKLSNTFNQRNFDGVFRLILLIYGGIMENHMS